jgi:TDG/mug DNA glycosylase family protein
MDEPTRAVYEAHAAEWAERRPPRLRTEAATFSQRCLDGMPIADLGCGPGTYFASLGRPLVGLDGARAMLAAGRAAAGDVAVVQADLAQLPFAPGRLGGAWARASYLHLRRHDLPAALAQLQRALAVGAPLEMTLRAGTAEGSLPDDDFPGRFFAHWEGDHLASVLVGAGFGVEAVDAKGDWLTARARALRTLPDFVGPGMRLLVCGLNPSLVAADAGFGYAGATNRFWPAAVQSGLISAGRARRPWAMLVEDGIGMTDLVKGATRRASELRPRDYRDGAARVAALVAWLRPRLVLFVGLAGYRAAVDRSAHAGAQPVLFGGAAAYVMPSTSGLNAATSLGELADHLRAAVAATAGA